MSFLSRLFGKPGKNELIVLKESYARQQQLLANEQSHVSVLLERIKVLENALLIPRSNPVESTYIKPELTPREREVIFLFETKESISAFDVFKALGYSCKQTASERVSSMTRKGLLKRVGNGRATKYILPV